MARLSAIIIITITMVAGCGGDRIKAELMRGTYIHDQRTNLCFYELNLGYNGGVLTNVPCTPEVMNQIGNLGAH